MVKHPAAIRWPGLNPWLGKNSWRRKWRPTPVLLPGKFHGQRSLVGYSPRGCKKSDTTEWLHFTSLTLAKLLTPMLVIYLSNFFFAFSTSFCWHFPPSNCLLISIWLCNNVHFICGFKRNHKPQVVFAPPYPAYMLHVLNLLSKGPVISKAIPLLTLKLIKGLYHS